MMEDRQTDHRHNANICHHHNAVEHSMNIVLVLVVLTLLINSINTLHKLESDQMVRCCSVGSHDGQYCEFEHSNDSF